MGHWMGRRDSFITHRAFCDALAEENNKVNNSNQAAGQTATAIPQQRPPELMSSLPLPNPATSATSILLNDFYDPKNNPLKSLPSPHDLVPMPFKPATTIPSPMFAPALFKASMASSPATSSLQLSSQTSSSPVTTFGYHLHDGRALSHLASPSAASAHMSATALLQKAAQMGATVSNGINSPMMHQKAFSTNMAGPDQLSSSARLPPPQPPTPPTTTAFGSGGGDILQQQGSNSYDPHHHYGYQPQHEQSSSAMAALNHNGLFGSHMSQLMETGLCSSQEMFTTMGMGGGGGGGDAGSFGMKNPSDLHHHEDSTPSERISSMNPAAVAAVRSVSGPSSMLGGNSGGTGNDMLTLDLLGISQSRQGGRGGSGAGIHAHHQRLPQMMGHGFGQHHHQQMDSATEKSMWNV